MAMDYYQRALKIREDLDELPELAVIQGQIGNLLMKVEQFAEAFRLLLSALHIFIKMESPNASIVAKSLKILRSKWGGFNAAWQEATGEVVSELPQ